MARQVITPPGQQTSGTSPTLAKPPPALPLQGPRLFIRPLQRRDLDRRQMWKPFNDPLHLIWDMPRCSPRENDSWFAQMTDGRRRLAYGVDDLGTQLAGMISLRNISWGNAARLGIAFSSEHVSQGYGGEALELFLPYYFLTLKFRTMTLDVAAANVRAVRCYHKAGFHQVSSHWQIVDGRLGPELFESAEYAPFRSFFRWRWGRAETLYYDMELSCEDWERSL